MGYHHDPMNMRAIVELEVKCAMDRVVGAEFAIQETFPVSFHHVIIRVPHAEYMLNTEQLKC